MWEKENKHIGVKIMLVVLILALGAGLFYAYQHVKAIEEQEDAELLLMAQEQQKEQNAARQASYEELEALYQQDLDTVARYLPGVVCWGDVITAGTAGGVSYPDTLQEYIDAAIVDKYNFYKSLPSTEGLGRIEDWSVYTVDIPVVNMGSGHESSATVCGRNGAIPYVVSEQFTIPAGTEPVPIKFTSRDGSAVTPLSQGDAGVNKVEIYGIEGTIALDLNAYSSTNSSKRYSYTFSRSEPGKETIVPSEVIIKTAASSMYRDYIAVICVGTYDGTYSTLDELLTYQKALINHQIANKDRYIVLGIYYLENHWDHGTYGDLEKYEAAMVKEYGDHFINVRQYLVSDGLKDAGIEGTKYDTDDIKHGIVPRSLRSTVEDSELNADGYKLLGKLVFDRMDKLGYFKEVKDELGITALEKEERQEAAKASSKN